MPPDDSEKFPNPDIGWDFGTAEEVCGGLMICFWIVVKSIRGRSGTEMGGAREADNDELPAPDTGPPGLPVPPCNASFLSGEIISVDCLG